MDQLFGLPAHPLVVHIPVVLLPLAAFGVGVMLVRRAWYERYRWAVLAIGAVGTLGAILAASSGEGLEGLIRTTRGPEAIRAIHDHVEAGDLARNLAILFFVALAAYVLIPWILDRPMKSESGSSGRVDRLLRSARQLSWLRPALMVFVGLTAVASMVSIVNAGHSGAKHAWEDVVATTGN